MHLKTEEPNHLDLCGLFRRLSPPVSSLHWWHLRTHSLRRKQTCSPIIHPPTVPNPSTPPLPALPNHSTPPNDSASPSTRSPARHPSLGSPTSIMSVENSSTTKPTRPNRPSI